MIPENLLRVTPRRSACPQHLRACELKCRTQNIYDQVPFENACPEMLRTDAKRRGYSQKVGG